MKMGWFSKVVATGLAIGALMVSTAQAEGLLEKAKGGEAVRIGFANEVPWAYPGDDNEALGFMNKHVIGVLNEMGITNIEPVVTEWGGLIPGLHANRFDIITGGMYILGERCKNVLFSEPMAEVGDAFIVKAGNPAGIVTYQDIKDKGALMVTGAGYNTVGVAKKEGIADHNVMQVPGPTEILAAVKAGRADAGAMPFFTARAMAEKNADIDVTDPTSLPEWTKNWAGMGFRHGDKEFVAAYNDAQAKYLGSEKMLAAVAEYGYTKFQVPNGITMPWVCENR